ncbi:Ppx/GppA phosphatase family protein [Clostridium tarantellae]|uniref:Ppx/GppA family phosphatase n=1 Tax=Clostridium tarantellae TaxID=39493 RepID=A0A6I1MW24_9CLOT|nr:Ppx/GppA phosphatase family protein [Clostridium tarantellae]MPQ45021.1 Ppx/GppA family phosphatase [Clostridium tarantellae]
MNRIGVIDIGSNAVRMTLAEVWDSGYFRIIDELKESIRLGSDLISCSIISEDKINFTLSTVKSFKDMCISSGASKIITVETEALRQAENKANFKSKLLKILDLDIKTLTNEEELYYNFLGARNSLYIKNSLLVDINGNTTHLAWIVDNEIFKKVSLPFGYVTLTTLFKLDDTICYENNEKSLKYIIDNLKNIDWLCNNSFESIIGIGGSIRNLGKIDRRKKRYPIDLSHNYVFFDYDIEDLYHMLKSKNLRQRKKIEGLSNSRADVIVAATGILKQILNFTQTSKIEISGRGLREGILYDYLEQNFNNKKDILDASLKGIMETLNVNYPHAYNVYNLTKKLFNELSSLHKLDNSFNNIVKTASLLHDCGISIRYYDHHIHSLYIILNSPLNGLSHKEILMSALCAAFHRNNSFEISLPKYSTILNRLDIANIEFIGVLLKLSEGLDRSLIGSIKDLKVLINDENVEIILFSDENLDLEIRQAYRCTEKFKEIYKKDLIITKKSVI